MNDKLTYGKILAKDKFVEGMKKVELTDAEIEREWLNLVGHFEMSVLELTYKALPEADRISLSDGVDLSDKDQLKSFFERIEKFVEDHPERVKRDEILAQAATDAYKRYQESARKEAGGNYG